MSENKKKIIQPTYSRDDDGVMAGSPQRPETAPSDDEATNESTSHPSAPMPSVSHLDALEASEPLVKTQTGRAPSGGWDLDEATPSLPVTPVASIDVKRKVAPPVTDPSPRQADDGFVGFGAWGSGC